MTSKSKIKNAICMLLLIVYSCSFDTGNLEVIGDMPTSLKEVSALEIVPNSDLFWVIEDSGNRAIVFGLDSTGTIKQSINIINARNRDWEDLTSDKNGNLYIGDFGNNRRGRVDYTIYKLNDLTQLDTKVESINFNLPKESDAQDFEAFFELDGLFFIFSKNGGKFEVYTVPNIVGDHTAKLVKQFNFEGRNNSITSADISDDGTMIILLNHARLWKLSDFKNKDFFEAIEVIEFNHSSQKEGICFGKNNEIYITDENSGMQGGNIYKLIRSSAQVKN